MPYLKEDKTNRSRSVSARVLGFALYALPIMGILIAATFWIAATFDEHIFTYEVTDIAPVTESGDYEAEAVRAAMLSDLGWRADDDLPTIKATGSRSRPAVLVCYGYSWHHEQLEERLAQVRKKLPNPHSPTINRSR